MIQATNSVAAIVVTYNRLELLQQCIDGLRAQTIKLDKIIIVNNNSTDGTTEWLATQQDLQTVTQENKGGAFGFYTGIKTASAAGYEWIWCMDDDGRPAADAMEQLINYADRKPCVMNALVLDKDNHENIVFKTGNYNRRADIKEDVIMDAANFFNGTLLHGDVVKKVGLPLKDLSIWGDETEYYNRIRYRNGLPVFTVSKSYHYHPAQYSIFYIREWDVRNDWKVYFYVRNKAFAYSSQYASRMQGNFAYAKFIALFLGTIAYYQKKDRGLKVKLVKRAAADGWRRDTSLDITGVKTLLKTL